MLIFILLTLTCAKVNAFYGLEDAFYLSRENSKMVVHATIFVRSDIECAMICMAYEKCCRTSYEDYSGECLMDLSSQCKDRIPATDGVGRTTMEKGQQFLPCTLPDEVHSAINEVNALDLSGEVKVGGNIEYTCNDTHYLTDGDLTRTCQLGPSWSGEAPNCTESCNILSEVPGTTHETYGLVLDGKINIGARIEYTCKANFKYKSGDLVRVCSSDGVWTGVPPFCQEDCKRSIIGYDYQGSINVTASGKGCQRWEDDSPHDHGFNNLDAENYCRNPDKEDTPWCYTLDPDDRFELCTIPMCTLPAKECMATSDGVDYFGTVNRTMNNITCQKWAVKTPHSHRFTYLLEQENYCRNPYSSKPYPWCYTTDPNTEWDFCEIPECKKG